MHGLDGQTVQMERCGPTGRSVLWAVGQRTLSHTWVASCSPLSSPVGPEIHSPTEMLPTENFPFLAPTLVSSSWVPSGLWIY